MTRQHLFKQSHALGLGEKHGGRRVALLHVELLLLGLLACALDLPSLLDVVCRAFLLLPLVLILLELLELQLLCCPLALVLILVLDRSLLERTPHKEAAPLRLQRRRRSPHRLCLGDPVHHVLPVGGLPLDTGELAREAVTVLLLDNHRCLLELIVRKPRRQRRQQRAVGLRAVEQRLQGRPLPAYTGV